MQQFPRLFSVLALVLATTLASLAVPVAPPALAEPGPTQVQTPDATAPGPFAITSAEYKFPASLDAEILPMLETEIWARVWRPQTLPATPSPLIVMLHGNHNTCGRGDNPRIDDRPDYTYFGTCPPGYTVVPNHEGYSYLAERLASWGYIVVSINANRGITASDVNIANDFSLVLARGRLVLRHLQLWSEWNRVGGAPNSLGVGGNGLVGKVDFGNVGLLGHSRGGEGVRAAYTLYRDPGSPWPARIPGLQVKAIFEIAPTDRGSARILNAQDTAWAVLLPMCDADLFNLPGVRPFDRMLKQNQEGVPTQKATYTVWGANHNFYNTEWQEIEPGAACVNHTALFEPGTIGSAKQRQTALESVLALFRGNLGANPTLEFNRTFNPLAPLPPEPPFAQRTTIVERGFLVSADANTNILVEDFSQPTGRNTSGVANEANGIVVEHSAMLDHDPVQRSAQLSWRRAGQDIFFQTNWADLGRGRDVRNAVTLDMRLASRLSPVLSLDPAPTNFSVQLAHADGSFSSPVEIQNYVRLNRTPVGGPVLRDLRGIVNPESGLHTILQTARMPLSDFANAKLDQVRGVRLTFNRTLDRTVSLANVQFTTRRGVSFDTPLPASQPAAPQADAADATVTTAVPGTGTAMTRAEPAQNQRRIYLPLVRRSEPTVDITLYSPNGFPIRNAPAVLQIGNRSFQLTRDSGDYSTRTYVFVLSQAEFAQLNDGDPVVFRFGPYEQDRLWFFGPLNKRQLRMVEQAQQTQQDALHTLTNLRTLATDPADQADLDLAITSLQHALTPAFWHDPTRVQLAHAEQVFGAYAVVAQRLAALAQRNPTSRTAVTAQALLHYAVLDVARSFALVEEPPTLSAAAPTTVEQQVWQGDDARRALRYDDALTIYKQAWQAASP